jgi:hypothetical protein
MQYSPAQLRSIFPSHQSHRITLCAPSTYNRVVEHTISITKDLTTRCCLDGYASDDCGLQRGVGARRHRGTKRVRETSRRRYLAGIGSKYRKQTAEPRFVTEAQDEAIAPRILNRRSAGRRPRVDSVSTVFRPGIQARLHPAKQVRACSPVLFFCCVGGLAVPICSLVTSD